MSQKRMFDKAIIDTDKFMDMAMSSKALYFLLGMEADDEGFVSYKKVMRVHGGNEDDIKVLIAKGFIIHFDSGVVVITDWNKNNWLDSRRVRQTEYKKEKSLLSLTDSKEYVLSNRLAFVKPEENRIEENRIEEITPAVSEVPLKKSKVVEVDGVASVIKAFEAVDPKNKTYYGNKTQRTAAAFLIKEYGIEQVVGMVGVLQRVSEMETPPEYFPSVTSPYDLKEKWVKIKQAVQRAKINQNKATDGFIW